MGLKLITPLYLGNYTVWWILLQIDNIKTHHFLLKTMQGRIFAPPFSLPNPQVLLYSESIVTLPCHLPLPFTTPPHTTLPRVRSWIYHCVWRSCKHKSLLACDVHRVLLLLQFILLKGSIFFFKYAFTADKRMAVL